MDKPKFNLIDGLIVLALIAVIAAGIMFFNNSIGSNSNSSQSSAAVYQVEFTQCDLSLYDAILAAKNNNETVWIGEKERFEAKINDVVANPATKIVTNQKTGEAVLAEYPDTYDITVTLESPVTETDAHITASNTAITVGSEVTVKGKAFAGHGFIVSLETVK